MRVPKLFEHLQLNDYLAAATKGLLSRRRHSRIIDRIERKVNAMSFKHTAAIAIAALVIYGCSATSDDATPTTNLATTTTGAQPTSTTTKDATTTTSTPQPRIETAEALATAEQYFEAYNSGEQGTLLALFPPDATFSDNFGAQSRSSWEQLLAWNMAQGTQLESVECEATEATDQSVTVVCQHTNLDAVIQAVGGPPVPVTLTLSVTSDGIAGWEFIFGQPDFTTVLGPFGEWMSAHHPDDASKVGFGNWSSVETATENGQLMAQYAEVWQTYLADNGCTFADSC